MTSALREAPAVVDRIVSIPEAAARLGIATGTLQRMRLRGEIKVLQISPRRIGIRESELIRVQNSLAEAPIAAHVPQERESAVLA
ncbi:hypothetical protein W911_14675 [Hyphomicrobium nitrativorans NL23]|uniref:Helix-turn-helix domain-containing protein n=1 Tax=Hyphomicrobium nitrativorans NL23 TaxID=1029756 RepID=V5SIP5_9HYPH|nr:helix-turn-helix domain-containing protein [Hyphomicrobium nitrativorans]AHB50357.1 hypothetical protein W911_14675 [Hyphomicrobium nitrativorans NL23]